MMTDKRFAQLVSLGIEAIPERFLAKLANVAVVVMDTPTQEQLLQNHVPDGETLLGLYEGIPLTERGENYGGLVLPDKITIFKLPIIEAAGDDEREVCRMVKETVWHEIAHYFGYDDGAIEEREEKGTNFSQ
jgi:predicted Zn-dependent protease with MMP-like domain